MTDTKKTVITSKNLILAANRTVAIPAVAGHHLAQGFIEFALSNISNPGAGLGNDAFTEVYFTTVTGNLYKIWKREDSSGKPGHWAIANARTNAGKKPEDSVLGYPFPQEEIDAAVVTVGQPFKYGRDGVTSIVSAILAVNALRCYARDQNPADYESDIRNEFLRIVAGKLTT